MSSKITMKQATYNVEMTETELNALNHLLAHVTYKTENPFYHISQEISYVLPEPDLNAVTFEVWDEDYGTSVYNPHVDIEFREDWDQ